MAHLFEPFTLKGVTLRNRVGVAPMCQYSCENGLATNWHLVHLGSRAVGGAAVVIAEATAVEARGRISPQDLGIWSDAHAEALAPTAKFIKENGAVPGIQLAHAGRKASTYRPWAGKHGGVPDEEGGWPVIAPSAIPFSDTYRQPSAMSLDDIHAVQMAFRDAAVRALDAGFEWIEIHGAHGYLMHEFLSPLSNQRTDQYGGSFENRLCFVIETARLVRAVVPERLPLTIRLSCSDWVEGGWDLEGTVELAKRLKAEGVDLIDCSGGGNSTRQQVPNNGGYPGYMVPFAEMVRREAEVATAAVGLISSPAHADEIIRNDRADLVFFAREMLRDPYWPIHAAKALKQDAPVPPQYLRGY
ncbi:MAG TPA: NADH:flavin oxidoreductase/NADH oxidase [Phototrophicaceae bacterium]|nr:NADH:flavin oxidoreductase/NADH oxidase [Phototrophicaceae bacterium]